MLVSLTLADRKSDSGDARLRFAISDTGPGLKEADRRRIFEEFEQVDDARTRRHNGAGLGLAISRRIIEKMGGQISVDSRAGEGSTFSFELDLPALGAGPGQTDVVPGTVMLLAPDCFERQALASHIEDHGGQAMCCESIEQASQLAGGRLIDRVIIDCRLHANPVELLDQLRQKAAEPFRSVALVSPAERSTVETLLENGFDHWLMRPVRLKSLREVLRGTGNGQLPASRAQSASAPQPSPNDEISLNILLAEDNEINQLLARKLMEHAGHRVVIANNGREAVAVFRERLDRQEGRFDLVLTDLHMPEVDGMETIEAIRRLEAEAGLKRIPILVLSADEQKDIRDEALHNGADGFIAKPIDADRLAEAVGSVL